MIETHRPAFPQALPCPCAISDMGGRGVLPDLIGRQAGAAFRLETVAAMAAARADVLVVGQVVEENAGRTGA